MTEDKLPRHPALRDYLQAHPVEGYDHKLVIDRSDGLGPRAVGWPDKTTPPDAATIDAWVAQQKAAEDQRLATRASRRAALVALRDGTGDLTARQLTALLRLFAREVLGDD